ncbi:hypothetical protein ACUOA8_47260, partial [Escherichia sp. SS-MK2]
RRTGLSPGHGQSPPQSPVSAWTVLSAEVTLTPVIVADSDRVQEITLFSGPVIAGETPVFDISSQ